MPTRITIAVLLTTLKASWTLLSKIILKQYNSTQMILRSITIERQLISVKAK